MLLAYMKPTNYCNVGCDHCYLPLAVRANKNLMSMETLEDAAILLKDMSNRYPGRVEDVQILWHGGEPLTVPMEWYVKAGNILDIHLPNRVEAIQTSLIPLTERHIEFIQDRLDWQIGTSIDFSQRKIKGSVDNFSGCSG